MEAAARPLPRLDTTPPVTKMYFADNASPLNFGFGWRTGWARSSIAEWVGDGKRVVRGRREVGLMSVIGLLRRNQTLCPIRTTLSGLCTEGDSP
jgi:hypothetical protein